MLLRAIAFGLLGAYVGFFVGWMGLVFPETVVKNLPERAPVRSSDGTLPGFLDLRSHQPWREPSRVL